MTLTEFLLARIAEDEAVARQASIGPVWTWDDRGDELLSDHRDKYGPECIIDTEGANPPGPEPGTHIARHDPARVLAECEAKRRIVEHCDFDHLALSPGDPYVLQLLALPYADHPDYLEEWRP